MSGEIPVSSGFSCSSGSEHQEESPPAGIFDEMWVNDWVRVVRVWADGSAPVMQSLSCRSDVVLMAFALSGSATLVDQGGSTCAKLTPGVGKLFFCEQDLKLHVEARACVSLMLLSVSKQHLFCASGECIHHLFEGCGQRGAGVFRVRTVQMSMSVTRALAQFGGIAEKGPLRFIFLTAWAYGVMGTFLTDLINEDCPCRLSERDVMCLKKAREILEADLTCPPTIIELARAVGINDCKLKMGFKALFKVTPFTYLRERRMHVALEELKRGNATVATVAGKVGYSNPGHFAAAFRKQFGAFPKDIKSESKNRPRRLLGDC